MKKAVRAIKKFILLGKASTMANPKAPKTLPHSREEFPPMSLRVAYSIASAMKIVREYARPF